jgi:ABC-type Fe3+/spermidine/putrescine transport system ATPase subunit
MTVGENISYGLKMHKFSSDSIQNQVNKYLELVEMVDYIDQKPNELSGGQQQRISIARALAYEPDILLLDEPLTGLDRVLRENLRNEIIQVQHEVDITTLYVTHDQEEALAMSDRVIVLNEGQKQQVGPPDELYRNPKNEFVAEFIGKSTKFTGKPVSNSPDIVSIGTNEIQVDFEHESIGEEVTIFVRPQHITINNNDPTTQGPNTYRAKIKQIENLGNRAEVEAELMDGKILTAESDSFPDFKIDDEVSVHIDSEEVIVL